MGSCNSFALIIALAVSLFFYGSHAANHKLFREYIGADSNTVRLSDVPINPNVEFHFILSFAIDYTNLENPFPTDGKFNVFWETNHLNPSDISLMKQKHPNVKFAVSLGGWSVGKEYAFFAPASADSWVKNAIFSITSLVKEFGLDGIDIDYEHFRASPDVFADCIGRLVTRLKKDGVISFASIAPFANDDIQAHYLALWRKYGHVIDYVNFQFYAYDRIGVSQFVGYFNQQVNNYKGGQILASFESGRTAGGLHPVNGFFQACEELKRQGKLGGIFIWSADESVKSGFQYEKKFQELLAA